tara:strand:- start:2747 stop:3325 length:579 start_codon:yes stop_codon:yes gene_type:complete
MNTGWATEKIHSTPFSARGLITKQTNRAVFFENRRHIRGTSFFGKYLLPPRFPELSHKLIQKWIIKFSRNRKELKTEDTEKKCSEFKIAVMPRENYLGAIQPKRPYQLFETLNSQVPSPGCFSNDPWGVRDFNNHKQEMFPHCTPCLLTFLVSPIRKGSFNIVQHNVPPNIDTVRKKIGPLPCLPLKKSAGE